MLGRRGLLVTSRHRMEAGMGGSSDGLLDTLATRELVAKVGT